MVLIIVVDEGARSRSVEVQNSHASLNGQPSGRVILFQRARNRTPVEPFLFSSATGSMTKLETIHPLCQCHSFKQST